MRFSPPTCLSYGFFTVELDIGIFAKQSPHGTQSFQKNQKFNPHGIRGFPGVLWCVPAGGSVAGVRAWCKFMLELLRKVYFSLEKYVKFDLIGFRAGFLVDPGFLIRAGLFPGSSVMLV